MRRKARMVRLQNVIGHFYSESGYLRLTCLSYFLLRQVSQARVSLSTADVGERALCDFNVDYEASGQRN